MKKLELSFLGLIEFKFKRDSTGPLTYEERRTLNTLKMAMAEQQYQYDFQKTNKKVDPSKYLTEDGYLKCGFVDEGAKFIKSRDELDKNINELFESNGIKLPKTADLKFNVDMYQQVKVTGNIDDEMKAKLEGIISGSKIAKRLEAIGASRPAKEQLYTRPEYSKYNLNKILMRDTGLNIKDFELKDNELVSKSDGRNISEVYSEYVNKNESIPSTSKGYVKNEFNMYLKETLRYGYNGIKDVSFNVAYQENGVQEIDPITGCGYGTKHRGWYESIKKIYG